MKSRRVFLSILIAPIVACTAVVPLVYAQEVPNLKITGLASPPLVLRVDDLEKSAA